MPLSFPSSPTVGQSSTQNGRTYVWSGAAWELATGSWAVANPVFTGTVTIPGGSAESPALVSATGTADTGLYFPAADSLSLATAGVQRLNVNANGALGVGGTGVTHVTVNVARPLSGGADAYGVVQGGVVQPAVTAAAFGYYNVARTASDTFACGSYTHFYATQDALGAGSTLDYQYGLNIASTLTGASTNIGVRSGIPSGSNRWNIYCEGTAANWFAGNVGIGADRSAPASALDVNGVITVASGSDTAPAIRPTGDTNTGIYFPIADTAAIATGGLARMTVQSGGNIVIGQDNSATASAQAQLVRTANGSGTNVAGADMRIQSGRGTGTAAGGALRFLTTPAGGVSNATLNTAVERVTITASGNVGIGTSSPAVPLDVNGSAIRIASSSPPASASASGVQGEIRWDTQYLYVCVATNAWTRTPLSPW